MTIAQTPQLPAQPEVPNRRDAQGDATHGDLGVVKAIKVWGIASAAVLGLSVFLPWITALGASVALIEGDGPFLLGAAAVVVAVIVRRPQWIGARALAVVAGGLGLYALTHVFTGVSDVRAEAGGFGVLVSVAFGAYLACLAALSLVAWAAFTQFRKVAA